MTYSLALHGGAGTISRARMTPEREAAYRAGLARALAAGEAILRDGGAALDAVVASVSALEDDPLFNAGRGAVFTSAGRQEMDAAVMDGRNRAAGAVAGVFGPRNPVQLARAVMTRTAHVMLIGAGALDLARAEGLEFADPAYFHTQTRWDALQETLALRDRGRRRTIPRAATGPLARWRGMRRGNLAAATSTGGMTAKAPGRVGDTPLIGAGTFADNETCAVSCTGHGEVFIRWTAAAEVAARMRHRGETVGAAAEHVVQNDLAPNDGSGGLIAVDGAGNIAMPFNSEGMYRAAVRAGTDPVIAIF